MRSQDRITEYHTELNTAVCTPAEAVSLLLNAGALDAFYTLSVMGGIRLCVLARENGQALIQKTLGSIAASGITSSIHDREILSREIETLNTDFGTVHRKIAYSDTVRKKKLEFDDIREISRKTGRSIREIREEIERCDSAKENSNG